MTHIMQFLVESAILVRALPQPRVLARQAVQVLVLRLARVHELEDGGRVDAVEQRGDLMLQLGNVGLELAVSEQCILNR